MNDRFEKPQSVRQTVLTGNGTRECELEEPIFKTNGIILHEKTTCSDKGGSTGAIQITTVRKGISDRPKGQSTTSTV